jgi:hypothetical protein
MRRVLAAWAWPIVVFLGFTTAAWLFFPGGPRPPSGDTPTAAPFVAPAEHINTRSWRTISLNPAGHAEERLILWGQATQVSATPDGVTVRANVDAAHHTPRNGTVNYPTSVIMHGDQQTLRNLARGNIFKAEVTVDGPPPGGGYSTPSLTVTRLTITDRY